MAREILKQPVFDGCLRLQFLKFLFFRTLGDIKSQVFENGSKWIPWQIWLDPGIDLRVPSAKKNTPFKQFNQKKYASICRLLIKGAWFFKSWCLASTPRKSTPKKLRKPKNHHDSHLQGAKRGDVKSTYSNGNGWPSGSPKRWDRWHSPSHNWQEKCHLYTTYSPCLLGCYMLPIPPFRGTRNNHWKWEPCISYS